MGRKPISDTVMTPAERQQRRRAGLKQEQVPDVAAASVEAGDETEEVGILAPVDLSDVDLSSLSDDALAALIERLEAEAERRRDSVTLGSVLAKARHRTAL